MKGITMDINEIEQNDGAKKPRKYDIHDYVMMANDAVIFLYSKVIDRLPEGPKTDKVKFVLTNKFGLFGHTRKSFEELEKLYAEKYPDEVEKLNAEEMRNMVKEVNSLTKSGVFGSDLVSAMASATNLMLYCNDHRDEFADDEKIEDTHLQ